MSSVTTCSKTDDKSIFKGDSAIVANACNPNAVVLEKFQALYSETQNSIDSLIYRNVNIAIHHIYKRTPCKRYKYRCMLCNLDHYHTLTAVSLVISLRSRSKSSGRDVPSSFFKWSPRIEITRPMQDIAHSFTS